MTTNASNTKVMDFERRTIEVELETPVLDETKGDGEVLRRLTLKEPRVRELRLATDAADGKGQVALARELLSACSGVLPAVIDRFTLADFNRANEALGELMPKALQPEAGGTAKGF